jgi:hypothetical protein
VSAEGLADLGASVTGEASGPLENIDASSAVSRRVVEERSSLCGKAGRWRDESDMVDPRLPGTPLDPLEPPEVGGGDIWVECCSLARSSVGATSELGPGRGALMEVGDRDIDFERVRDATAAFSASWRRFRSLPKSRCKTAIDRSLPQGQSIWASANHSSFSY